MEQNSNINSLLISLFSGDTTNEDKVLIEKWLLESKENRKTYADLRDIWLSSGIHANADNYDIEGAIQDFKSKISKSNQKNVRKLHLLKAIKYAAMIVLILSLPFIYWMGLKNSNANAVTTITCDYGDRTNIVLPDSTHVWLNSGSRLTFNNNFTSGGRNVTLEGEAYFSVTKDKKHPFKVKTSDVDVVVLGTEFNLKAYPDGKSISTTLVTGSLLVYAKGNETTIKPNQKAVFSRETKRLIVDKLPDTLEETDWINGRMVFRNQTLGDLEKDLERWFDVDIVFKDETVKRLRFTGNLQRESILEALSYFSYSPYLNYKLKGNMIIFYSK